MKWAEAARKIRESCWEGLASAASIRTGAAATIVVFSPACAVEQAEQTW